MFNKRLINIIPKAMNYVKKQVLYQWFSLICNIIFTITLSLGITKLIENKLRYSAILAGIIFLFFLFILRGTIIRKISYYSFQSASLVKIKLRKLLFEKVLLLGNNYQDYVSTSELTQLGVEGINQLEIYFSLYLPQLFYSLVAPVTLFILISFFDFTSAIVLFLCVPLIPVSIVLVQKFAKKLLSKYWDSYTSLGDSFLENIQGLTTLKIYGSDQFKQEEMNKEAEDFRKATMRVLIMQLNSISIMDVVAYGGAGLGSFLAVDHYLNNEISLFAALLIILVSFEFFIPLRQLGSFFHIAMNGIAAADKLFAVLDIPHQQVGTRELEGKQFDLSIQNLNFGYKEERQILKNIQMHIQNHKFIGIVGESGSGKSTLAKLIMGFHREYMGAIYIQNKERRELDDQEFMKHFIYVTHDPMIFKGTVKENLDFFNQYQEKEIWDILSKVHLKEFFENQAGLETMLLESGSNLSGGQKQRLNLARALLKNGEVYIFDEATSNIDVESENQILSIINELSKIKTVIMITHRLSSVINCDEIFVMKNGQLIENGSHLELIKNNGVYSQLLNQQKELEVYQR